MAAKGIAQHAEGDIGAPLQPTPLQVWLTARWGAHTRKAGRTWWVPNDHREWPLYAAEIEDLRDDLVTASGTAVAGTRLPAMFSPGVAARFGKPVPVR